MQIKPKAVLFLWLLLRLSVVGQAQFFYATNNNKLTIVAYTGSASTVTIPSAVDGLPVVAIASKVFINSRLTGVTIPSSVTSIGSSAFAGCTALTSVVIPNGVTSLAASIFSGCYGLTSVVIPGSVTSIGNSAFADCKRLTSVTIPNGVIYISSGAFAGLTGLTQITIPRSVTYLDYLAFSGSVGLASISVDDLNPAYCSVDGVVFNKARTTLVKMPEGWKGSFVVPDGVTSIGVLACAGCRGLTDVSIPDSVTGLEVGAFSDCSALTGITLPSRITSIETYAFTSCSRLTQITIPSEATYIGDHAFAYCVGLTSVTIPSGVKSIDSSAFANCTNLNAVYFQGDAPHMTPSAFTGVHELTFYCLPERLGWSVSFGGLVAVLWDPQIKTGDASFGVQAGLFGFDIACPNDLGFVVEATTNLAKPDWVPVSTNTIVAGGASFSDPQWKNFPGRLYRLRMP